MFKKGDKVLILSTAKEYFGSGLEVGDITTVVWTGNSDGKYQNKYITVEAHPKKGWSCPVSSTGTAYYFPLSYVKLAHPVFRINFREGE